MGKDIRGRVRKWLLLANAPLTLMIGTLWSPIAAMGQTPDTSQVLNVELPPDRGMKQEKAAIGAAVGLVAGYGAGAVVCLVRDCAAGSSQESGTRIAFSIAGGVIGSAFGAARVEGEHRGVEKFLLPAVLSGVAAAGIGIGAVLIVQERVPDIVAYATWSVTFSLAQGFLLSLF